MQKQRSPYTAGGINQFKGATVNTDILSTMPFMLQLGQQGSGVGLNAMRGVSMKQGLEPRGQRSGTPRSENPPPKISLQDCYNGPYEGDVTANDFDQKPVHRYTEQPSFYKPSVPVLNESFQTTGQMMPVRRIHPLPNDTDSDSEYEEPCILPEESLFYRGINYIKDKLSLQRQERMANVMKQYKMDSWLNRVILMVQLISILTTAAVEESVHMSVNATQLSFRLWRCKFQLRSLLRQMLWSMASAKGHDAFLFLGVVFMAPWLFLLSLLGFAIAIAFLLKDLLKAIACNFI